MIPQFLRPPEMIVLFRETTIYLSCVYTHYEIEKLIFNQYINQKPWLTVPARRLVSLLSLLSFLFTAVSWVRFPTIFIFFVFYAVPLVRFPAVLLFPLVVYAVPLVRSRFLCVFIFSLCRSYSDFVVCTILVQFQWENLTLYH